MQFSSWSDFFNMGGYSLFVWLSFGGTFVVMITLILHSYRTSTLLKKTAIDNEKRQQRIRQSNLHREHSQNINEATK